MECGTSLDKGQARKMHWSSEIHFPNSHYFMHDTPSKAYLIEKKAFSHGCIRLARPRDLAIEILKDDKNWTAEKDRYCDE
jgi:murein L,D-transpeptidase YcbB/YkuD